MRIFKNKWFGRFARREGITDEQLCEAVRLAEAGLVDADLGGSIIKQRLARLNQGKSGGFRTLLVFRTASRAVFVFGFAKNDIGNISVSNLKVLKLLAAALLDHSDAEIQGLVDNAGLVEVFCHEDIQR